jgi:ubiquinone/menaquinone biosynthesis C-methylase UbiE
MERTKSLFDFGKMAQEYEKWYETPEGKMHDQQQKKAIWQCLPQALPGHRLLDIGCGTGHWSRIFAARGFEVTGVDLSPEMIAVARAGHSPGCRFEIADACCLPFDNDSFEVVAAITSLVFIAEPKTAVSEMFRCVKKKGKVIIGSLNCMSPFNKQRLFRKEEPYISARLFSAQELKKLLLPYGRIKICFSGPYPEMERPSTQWREREEFLWGEPNGALIVAEVQL